MALGKTLLSLVRLQVVAQLERCGCPILYTPVPKFQRFPEKTEKLNFFGTIVFYFPEIIISGRTEIFGKSEIMSSLRATLRLLLPPYQVPGVVYHSGHWYSKRLHMCMNTKRYSCSREERCAVLYLVYGLRDEVLLRQAGSSLFMGPGYRHRPPSCRSLYY